RPAARPTSRPIGPMSCRSRSRLAPQVRDEDARAACDPAQARAAPSRLCGGRDDRGRPRASAGGCVRPAHRPARPSLGAPAASRLRARRGDVIHRRGSALRRPARIAARRPRAGLWTLLALSCALFVAAAAVIAAEAVDRWAGAHPPRGGNLVVYLGDGVDEAHAQALVGELRALRGVERAELVSATESAHRLVRALGPDPALLEGVDIASLPASVEVK